MKIIPVNFNKEHKAMLAFVEKINHMLQRQIVVKALGTRIDIKDPAYTKYAVKSFQFIVWMLRFDIVTIKRNAAVLHRYEIIIA